MKYQLRKAVFPVAGLGTRFLPATKSIPKEIMTLVDRPLIQYAIDEAREAGIEEFIFVTARGKSALEDYFDRAPELEKSLLDKGKDALHATLVDTNMKSGQIVYVRQTDPLGLGHAVSCAQHLIRDEAFAVILTDDVVDAERSCLAQMVEAYQETGGHMLATMAVEGEAISAYGVLDVQAQNGRIHHARSLVEKPALKDAPSNQAVIGRYILHSDIFAHLSGLGKGAGGEIQLTDAISAAAQADNNVYGLNFDGQRYDCGSKSGYLEATVAFGLKNPELRAQFMDYLRNVNLTE